MPPLSTTPFIIFLFIPPILAATFPYYLPLFFSCSPDTFISQTPFASNLQTLISTLISAAPKTPNLFLLHTAGAAGSPQAFGLAQCRPDASALTCSACLQNAAGTAFNRSCQGSKSASVRNPLCVLRYADHIFASVLEDPNFNSKMRPETASDPVIFGRQVEGMLDGVLRAAVNTPLKIAAGIDDLDTGKGFMKVYGLAWCTADLSPDSCYQCLDHALKSYVGCCADKIGGFSVTVSCIVVYNNVSFFNDSLIQVVSAPPPPESGTRKHAQRKKIIMAASISASVLSALIIFYIILSRRRRALSKKSKLSMEENFRSMESHMLPLASLKSATNNFSNENKLREGSFGPVYKGVLSDGQQVMVKRLSKTSGQGLVELKNEADLVAQLQHKNLVKLLGCCMQDDEQLLVYEFLPNGSLDRHLYDPARRAQLDWDMRHLIIEGIARGLVYLHNHSRLRIIHRNLNASNILLDGGMNPKISDFGLAKLVSNNESQWDTKQVAGALGYMAPEYAMRGLFSTKSDVFSYGMVVLEIITGRRTGSFIEAENGFNLQTYIWEKWDQEKAEEVIDHGLEGQYQVDQVLRCINIGLLCIQADPKDRPSMVSVVLMLTSNTEMLLAPSLPAYFTGEDPTGLSSTSSYNYDMHSTELLLRDSSISEGLNEAALDIM